MEQRWGNFHDLVLELTFLILASDKFLSKIGRSRNLSRLGSTRRARILVLRSCQQQHYGEIVAYFSNDGGEKPQLIDQLHLFMATDGLIRSRGRLHFAGAGSDLRHPILLPPAAKVTELIINFSHVNNLHAGASQVLADL